MYKIKAIPPPKKIQGVLLVLGVEEPNTRIFVFNMIQKSQEYIGPGKVQIHLIGKQGSETLKEICSNASVIQTFNYIFRTR